MTEQDLPRLDAGNLELAPAPGIRREPGANRVLVLGITDEQEALFVVAERPTEDDETARVEVVHEAGVLGPPLLLPHRLRLVPRGPANASDGEVARETYPTAASTKTSGKRSRAPVMQRSRELGPQRARS